MPGRFLTSLLPPPRGTTNKAIPASCGFASKRGRVRGVALLLAGTLALAACQPVPSTKQIAAPVPPSPRPAEAPTPPPAVAPAPLPAPKAVQLPSMDLPAGPIYVCEVDGARTPIALPEGTEGLCRRHPEMGPCRYERDTCRLRGGKVLTSKGEEVTRAVEDAYDQRVQRIRFKGG